MNLDQQDWISQFEANSNAIMIDVRTEDEWNDGYIAQAIHLDIMGGHEFIEELEKLDKTKDYYVYCRSGARSGRACEIMTELGFANAYNLSGGILEWNGNIVEPEN